MRKQVKTQKYLGSNFTNLSFASLFYDYTTKEQDSLIKYIEKSFLNKDYNGWTYEGN